MSEAVTSSNASSTNGNGSARSATSPAGASIAGRS